MTGPSDSSSAAGGVATDPTAADDAHNEGDHGAPDGADIADNGASGIADPTADRLALVERLHAGPAMLVLAVTGGGIAVITDLLGVPGASRTVLEVVVPYAETSLLQLAGPLTDGAVSEATAQAMARACLERAGRLAPGHQPLIGAACTAALVSDRPKKGDHRAHLAVVAELDGAEVSALQLVVLEKGRRDRAGEDRVVADALLDLIASAARVEPRPFGPTPDAWA